MNYYLGCDVGENSACSLLDENMNLIYYEYPTIVKSELDLPALSKLFESIISNKENAHFFVGIEDVHAIHLSGASSNFNFGRAKGIIEMLIYGLAQKYGNISIFMLQPKEWQKMVWETNDYVFEKLKRKGTPDTKPTSFKAAKRLFPSHDFLKEKKSNKGKPITEPFDGFYDSALIAYATRLKAFGQNRSMGNHHIPIEIVMTPDECFKDMNDRIDDSISFFKEVNEKLDNNIDVTGLLF